MPNFDLSKGPNRFTTGSNGKVFKGLGFKAFNNEERRVTRTQVRLNTANHDTSNVSYWLDSRLPVAFRYNYAEMYNQLVIPKGRIVAVDPDVKSAKENPEIFLNVLTLANGGSPVRLRKAGDTYNAATGLVSPVGVGQPLENIDVEWTPVNAAAYTADFYQPFVGGKGPRALATDAGLEKDKVTGAVVTPIYLSAAYAHPGLGESTGFDYTRTKNPTRTILEEGLCELEEGCCAIATSSGMSAIQLVFELFDLHSEFLVSRDLYGGSFRYFDELERKGQQNFVYFTDENDLENKVTENTTAIYIETPTNPLMQEVSIERISKIAKSKGALLIVDNTLLTPLRQKPLTLGADIVIHSGTKYLTGHNDILAGVVVTNDEKIGERLAWLSNTTGAVLSAFDSWLFIRSLKTLPLRFNQQEKNAKQLAETLKSHPNVKEVLYPNKGAMLSFKLVDASKVDKFLRSLKVATFAESLGGVETLVTYPTTQTHFDIPEDLRLSYGLTPDLLRISVGIESVDDLIEDFKNALDS